MRLALLLSVALLGFPEATRAGSAPLDLVPYGRVTASGTRATFLGLWPRETRDAAYTVRDGDPFTGWKPPARGEHRLWVDLAPWSATPPVLESLSADWEVDPAGPVTVRVRTHCGGPVRFEAPWSPPTVPMRLPRDTAGLCIAVEVRDAGEACLAELRAFAAGSEHPAPPALRDVRVRTLRGPDPFEAVRITWARPGPEVHHVEIRYLAPQDDAGDGGVHIQDERPTGPWEGPPPARSGTAALLVPVSQSGARGPARVAPLDARRIPLLETSGVVEGFYGQPWSHRERRDLLLHLARIGLGTYVYGPKDDPLHRDRWREPYDAEAVRRFAELRELAGTLGVTFSFGISPGRDMDLRDAAELDTLTGKLRPLLGAGMRHVTLLFDDIEADLGVPIDGELGAAHAGVANRTRGALLREAGEDVGLWFVPTVYSDERAGRWPGGGAYLEALQRLHPSIGVLWTGTDTLSPTLEARDLAAVTRRTGRAPLLWENQHATDGGDGFLGKLYLAPYQARSADLPGALAGIVTNPMIPGAANRLVLGTYALYLLAPDVYDPYAASERAVEIEPVAAADRSLSRWLVHTFHGAGMLGFPGVNLPENPAMEAAIERFEDSLGAGALGTISEAAGDLLAEAARMASAQTALHHSVLDPALVDDFRFPANRLRHEGLALLHLLDWTGSLLRGEPAPEALGAADALLDRARLDRYALSLFRVNALRTRLAKLPPRDLGFTPPHIRPPGTSPVHGRPWTYAPASAPRLEVHGLPGAEVRDGVVHWTPPHPGSYEPVVVARSKTGWGWSATTLLVAPAPPGDPTHPRPTAPAGPAESGGGLCFIATAAYGHPDAARLRALEQFRDRRLRGRPLGARFVSAYEQVSPPLARYIAGRPCLRAVVRLLLLPAVGLAWLLA